MSVRPLEEAKLGDLREENRRLVAAAHVGKAGTAAAEAAAAAAAEAAVAARVRCVVCDDDFSPAHGVACGEGHFLCGHEHGDDCMGKYVRMRVEALRSEEKDNWAAEAAADPRRAAVLGGAVHCPCQGCGAEVGPGR